MEEGGIAMKKNTAIIRPIMWTVMMILWLCLGVLWYFNLRDFLPHPNIERKLLSSGIIASLAVVRVVVSWIRYAKDQKKGEKNQEPEKQ